jgi:hypothetical protein
MQFIDESGFEKLSSRARATADDDIPPPNARAQWRAKRAR